MGTFTQSGPLIEFLSKTPAERRKYLGQEIRETRAAYGVSQGTLASSIGVSQSFLANIEAGRRSPSPSMVISIVDYFQKEGEHAEDKDEAHRQEGD